MGFVLWYMYPNKYESMSYSLSSTGNNDVLQLKKKGNSLVNMHFSLSKVYPTTEIARLTKVDLDISSILSLE